MYYNVSRVITQFKTTVPKNVREKAHIKEGTFLQWDYNEDGTITLRPVLPIGITKDDQNEC